MIPGIIMISESNYNLWGHVEDGESILCYKRPVVDNFSAKGLISAGVSGEQNHKELQNWWTKDNKRQWQRQKTSIHWVMGIKKLLVLL